MTKVLATGASGFIGGFLAPGLLARGFQVKGTYRDQAELERIRDQAWFGEVEWVHIPDLGPSTEWAQALEGASLVIHLAALAHQIGQKGEGRGDEFHRVNVEGTRGLAQAVRARPQIRRLVFISSIGAISSLSKTLLTEESPCAPDNDYGRSKLEAEAALRSALEGASADWCIIRPCLVFGRGNPGNMERLLRLLALPLPLPLASVRGRRSYSYVENLAEALILAAEHVRASRQVFIYSEPETLPLPALLRKLGRSAGLRVRLLPCPALCLRLLGRMGDLVARITGRGIGIDTYSVQRLLGDLEVDSSKLRRALDWTPACGIEEAFQRSFSPKPTA